MSRNGCALLLIALVTSAISWSCDAATEQPEAAQSSLTAADRSEVVAALVRQMHDRYVYPLVADRVARELAHKVAHGAYAHANTVQSFAETLSKDLRDLGDDRHLRVNYIPDFKPEMYDEGPPTPDVAAQTRSDLERDGYGIERIERLPGNVGYLDVRFFGPAEYVGQAFDAALSILQGTDAMILDLRFNNGGDPSGVAELLSHFFALGDTRHLNDLYNRPKNITREYWTHPDVTVRYTKPVYVLTSRGTFSGGEECAYDFQTQKRATLIGEGTGGGANPGRLVSIGHGFVAFIPTGRAINPVTHANWEHVGVKPEISAPAAEAKKRAYVEILRTVSLPAAKNAAERQAVETLLSRVEHSSPEALAPDPPIP